MGARWKPVVVTDITGIEGLKSIIHGIDFAATQLAPGVCRGALLHADLDGLALSSGVFRADARVRSLTTSDKIMLGTILESKGSVIHWNHDVIQGDVCVCPSDHEQEGYFRGVTAYATILLSHDEIAEATAPFEQLGDPSNWRQISRFRASPKTRHLLCEKIDACVKLLRAVGPNLSQQALMLMRDDIVDAFLGAAAEAIFLDARLPHVPNGARTIRRVEDYMAARNRAPVPIGDICRDLNLSRRTLHRTFQETLGIGPKAYIRLASLSTARHALLEASPATASVTEIALDHGFFELGRFSVMYRQMFGESPSDTLRR